MAIRGFGLTIVRQYRTLFGMIIRSVQHKGLLRLIEDDDSRELRPDLVKWLRNILAVLITAADITKVVGPPG